MIGIVAASGGREAIMEILSGLPHGFAVPILVIFSMPDSSVSSFVAWLSENCVIPVTVAEDGQVPEPGRVYVAGGHERNLFIERGRLRLVERERSIYDPRDVLFRSMARELGPGAIAVILTGMGHDGPQGMKEVRDAGGYTIAQDESTSLIYATPRFAVEMNAACESLPIQEIGPRLVALVAPGPTGPH